MSKKYFITLTILVSLSFFTLIVMQLFWMNNAIQLSEKHYSQRAAIALEYLDRDINEQSDTIKHRIPKDSMWFDSLVTRNFIHHELSTYYYHIINVKKQDIVFSRYTSCNNITGKEPKLSKILPDGRHKLEVYFPSERQFVKRTMSWWLWLSIIAIGVLSFSFVYLLIVIVRHKKNNEIKNDFINNMTHEFKTPIATIGLASDVLLRADCNTSQDRIKKYLNIIQTETARLKKQVEKVLQIAIIERSDFKLITEPTDLHQQVQKLIHDIAAENFDKAVQFEWALEASTYIVAVDKTHFDNMIKNLVLNAYKYTREQPIIKISSRNHKNGIIISIADNGIGMNGSAKRHIFDKFYRITKGDVHDNKGIGLGLHYVKTVVQAHKGSITVQSEPRKGSTFNVYLPVEA